MPKTKWFKILLQIFEGWLGFMSGAISIPFAFLALFWTRPRMYFVVLAFFALWLCVLRLAYKNYPKFKLACSNDIQGCCVFNQNRQLKYFRLLIETNCSTAIENCIGHLIKIEKDGVVVLGHEIRKLPFALSTDPDAFSKTIHSAIPYYLDIICISSLENYIQIATFPPCVAHDVNGNYIFSKTGEYIFYIKVSGKDVPTQGAKIKFKWTGDRKTATMEKLDD